MAFGQRRGVEDSDREQGAAAGRHASRIGAEAVLTGTTSATSAGYGGDGGPAAEALFNSNIGAWQWTASETST